MRLRLCLSCFLAAALFFTAMPVHAVFWSGNKLITHMRHFEKAERSAPDVNWEDVGMYEGFVVAIYDANASSLCSGGQTSVGQICSVVVKFLNEHPELWDRDAAELVLTALRKAFPCK